MGRRKEGKGTKEHSDNLTSSLSISKLNEAVAVKEKEMKELDIRHSFDAEISTYLCTISELRERVTALQKNRMQIENEVLGKFDSTLPLKHQWKLIKKLKNEGNKTIFAFIDNLRQESKRSLKQVKDFEVEKENVQRLMAERHSKEEASLTCSICLGLYCKPFVVECGHVFCYFCLNRWVENQDWNGKCASCRTKLVKFPTPALFVEQQVDLLIEYSSEQKKIEYTDRLEMERSAFNEINNPWKGWYAPSANLIEDAEDNVERCGQCGWELEDELCSRCNTYYPDYRSRGDALDESSETGGVDIRFSDDESHQEAESGSSDVDGFIVEDNHIEYDSAPDTFSDSIDNNSNDSQRGIKRQRVIYSSDEE